MLVRSSGGVLRCSIDYRLYCLNDAMHVVSRQEIAAADDLAALKEAKKYCQEHAVELWQGARYVARVGRDYAWSDAPGHISP
jgi:hypothetical protein